MRAKTVVIRHVLLTDPENGDHLQSENRANLWNSVPTSATEVLAPADPRDAAHRTCCELDRPIESANPEVGETLASQSSPRQRTFRKRKFPPRPDIAAQTALAASLGTGSDVLPLLTVGEFATVTSTTEPTVRWWIFCAKPRRAAHGDQPANGFADALVHVGRRRYVSLPKGLAWLLTRK